MRDGAASGFPVSVKGVCLRSGRVLLVSNPRAEWELPGGKLEAGETPEDCLAREVAEETGLEASVGTLVDVWVYTVRPGLDVLVVTYGCDVASWPPDVVSPEGKAVTFAALDDLESIPLPAGYHRGIRRWARRQPG